MQTSPELSRRLSTLDATFLYVEHPAQPMHVASILALEGTLDYERVVAHIRARLPLIPRYTDRIMPAPFGIAHPTWERDPDFDLRRHVQHRTLRPPGDDEQLAEFCASLHARPLDRNRPLWEIYVIDGYRGGGGGRAADAHGGDGDRPARSVLYSKVHHCMIDGVSGVQLMGVLLDPSPAPPTVRPVPFPRARPLPGFTTRLFDAISDRVTTGIGRGATALRLLKRPGHALHELRATRDALADTVRTLVSGAPKTPFNGRLGLGRKLTWITFSLPETKSIKDRLGGSVNDIVLAVISGALRRVLTARGMSPDRLELRTVVPVNTRSAAQHLKLGNQVSVMIAPLPVGIYDPLERLRQVRDATALLKGTNESAKVQRLMDLLDLMPPPLQRMIGSAGGLTAPINTICTNVPGPPISLYMQGIRLERMIPFVPLAEGVGLAFAILSYADTITIGVTADAELVPDLHEIVVALHASFEELWAVTGLERVSTAGPVLPERQRRERRLASLQSRSVGTSPAAGPAPTH
jgi:WS/DGAT/MGAT family acyltransferase